jgi:hypothetical protein
MSKTKIKFLLVYSMQTHADTASIVVFQSDGSVLRHSGSIYHWEIKRTRQWIALDFYTEKNIVTGLQRRRLGNDIT